MEYYIQAWSPYMSKGIEVLENVHCRATKCVVGVRNKPYDLRLNTALEKRRQRGDLIKVYKILPGKEDIDSSALLLPDYVVSAPFTNSFKKRLDDCTADMDNL